MEHAGNTIITKAQIKIAVDGLRIVINIEDIADKRNAMLEQGISIEDLYVVVILPKTTTIYGMPIQWTEE